VGLSGRENEGENGVSFLSPPPIVFHVALSVASPILAHLPMQFGKNGNLSMLTSRPSFFLSHSTWRR
jgi:hypothetical protein